MSFELSPSLDNQLANRLSRAVALGGSLIIHLMVIFSLSITRLRWAPSDIVKPLEVSIVKLSERPPSPAPQRQMVTEPVSPIAPPPPETTLTAEHDHRTAREQIARGAGDSATRSKQPPAKPQKQNVSRPAPAQRVVQPLEEKRQDYSRQEKKSLSQGRKKETIPAQSEQHNRTPRAADLRLDTTSVLTRFADQGSESAREKNSVSAASFNRQSKTSFPTSDRLDAALAIASGSGSADNLSRVPDGAVTMLNAKADKFAVFVRRVAYRVFATLRETGWQSLAASHIRSIGRPVVVIAELTPSGKLVTTTIRQPSGSSRFDQVVEAAVQRSVSDPNPPEGARAADGRIRFIFQSRSTVSIAPSGTQGGLSERRWLELGTGLD